MTRQFVIRKDNTKDWMDTEKVDLNQQAESQQETRESVLSIKCLLNLRLSDLKEGGQRQLPLKLLVYLIHEAYSSESSQVEEVVVTHTLKVKDLSQDFASVGCWGRERRMID